MGDDITDPNAAPPLWPLLVIAVAAAAIVGALICWVTS